MKRRETCIESDKGTSPISHPKRGSANVAMSNIYPKLFANHGQKGKTPEWTSHERITPLGLSQETTFTERTAPHKLGSNVEEHHKTTVHPPPGNNRVLDSKGGPEKTVSLSTIMHITPYRCRTTSCSSDVASTISVSSNGSIIELNETGGSGRSRSSSSSCTTSSAPSIASVPAVSFKADQYSLLTQNTDSAIDIEEDETFEDFPNEAQPLLFCEDHPTTPTDYQGSEISLLSRQKARQVERELETHSCTDRTKLVSGASPPTHYKYPALISSTIINTTETIRPVKGKATRTATSAPVPQPSEVTMDPAVCEKENRDPAAPHQQVTSREEETPQASSMQSQQIPITENPTTNKASFNLQSVLGYRTPLSPKPASPAKGDADSSVLQVLVPVPRKITSKDNIDKGCRKIVNTRKKGNSGLNSVSPLNPFNTNLPPPSAHSQAVSAPTAASAIIHHFPCSEPSKAPPVKETGSNHQHPYHAHHPRKETDHFQAERIHHNIPHAQSLSLDSGFDQRESFQHLTPPEPTSMAPMHHPSSDTNTNYHFIPQPYTQVTEPYSNAPYQMSSDPWFGTQSIQAINQRNLKSHAPTMPNTCMLVPQGPQHPGYKDHNLVQTNCYSNNMIHPNENKSSRAQSDPVLEAVPFPVGVQAQQQIQAPCFTFMHPYNFPNVSTYGFASPWAWPVVYGGIPAPYHPSWRPDQQIGGFYPRYPPPSFQPYWIAAGSVPEGQHMTVRPPATLATNSIPSSQLHGPSVSLENQVCSEGVARTSNGLVEASNHREVFSHHNPPFSPDLAPCAHQPTTPATRQPQASGKAPQLSHVRNFHRQEKAIIGAGDNQNQADPSSSGPGGASGRTDQSTVLEMSSREQQADHSQTDSTTDGLDERSEQTSGRGSASTDPDGRNSGGARVGHSLVCIDVNGQEGPIPTVVATRRESLPSSIHSIQSSHSGPRETNSTHSQLPFFKDRRDPLRNPPSSCYKGLCIVSAVMNPVIGLVALLLLLLAVKNHKRQHFMRSSHLQLASIILSTCGIFITLNILFLLAVPWAVRLNSPLEVVHVGSFSRDHDITERCLNDKYGDSDRFLQDLNLDKESYCLVVGNRKLKEALKAYLVKAKMTERSLNATLSKRANHQPDQAGNNSLGDPQDNFLDGFNITSLFKDGDGGLLRPVSITDNLLNGTAPTHMGNGTSDTERVYTVSDDESKRTGNAIKITEAGELPELRDTTDFPVSLHASTVGLTNDKHLRAKSDLANSTDDSVFPDAA